jgi:hypothetical protein
MEAAGQNERTLRRQLVAFAQFTTRELFKWISAKLQG